MKTKQTLTVLLLLMLFFTFSSSWAQVTIGSNEPPVAGSLLDLKERPSVNGEANSDKGLLLPRMSLSSPTDFTTVLPGASSGDLDLHTGLVVFNVGSTGLCKGIYVLGNRKWNRLPESCKIKINCASLALNGAMEVGVPLDPYTNTLTLIVDAPEATAGVAYNITTDTQNGISYSGTGFLAAGTQTVTLTGSGSPKSGGKAFTLTVTPTFAGSDSSPVFCSITVPAGLIPIAKASVFGFGLYSGTFGYRGESSGSRSVLQSQSNFGIAANSTVRSSGFNFITPLNIDEITVANFVNSAPFQTDPDIIIHAYHSHTTSAAVIDALAAYLERGGVLILFDEYGSGGSANNIALRLCNKLFPDNTITTTGLGRSGIIYEFSSTINDDIINGSFGNIAGLKWGEDASATVGFVGLPADSVTVYSNGRYISFDAAGSPAGNGSAATVFKHNRLNLFVIGDGGFNSNNANFIGGNYSDPIICPFAISSSATGYKPIPRTTFGYANAYTVQNSIFFANLMTWAIKNARSNNR